MQPAFEIGVAIGGLDRALQSPEWEKRNVSRIVCHPGFNQRNGVNDICMLQVCVNCVQWQGNTYLSWLNLGLRIAYTLYDIKAMYKQHILLTLQLATKSTKQPVKVNYDPSSPMLKPGREVRIMGWGSINSALQTFPRVLQQATTTIIPLLGMLFHLICPQKVAGLLFWLKSSHKPNPVVIQPDAPRSM